MVKVWKIIAYGCFLLSENVLSLKTEDKRNVIQEPVSLFIATNEISKHVDEFLIIIYNTIKWKDKQWASFGMDVGLENGWRELSSYSVSITVATTGAHAPSNGRWDSFITSLLSTEVEVLSSWKMFSITSSISLNIIMLDTNQVGDWHLQKKTYMRLCPHHCRKIIYEQCKNIIQI